MKKEYVTIIMEMELPTSLQALPFLTHIQLVIHPAQESMNHLIQNLSVMDQFLRSRLRRPKVAESLVF